MKKAIQISLLLFCSTYFWLFTSAQQGQQEGQNKSGSSLPTPTVNKIIPVGTESNPMPQAPQMTSFRCGFASVMWGNSINWGNTSYEAVEQAPEIGIKAEEYPADIPLRIGSTGSHELWIAHRIIFKDVRYDVALNIKHVIRRINTDDSRFRTPEGLGTGDSLEKALKASGHKPVNANSCLYYLKLESGWNAVFLESDILKDGTLSPSARVASFYKEN